jgi:hypothetical protein
MFLQTCQRANIHRACEPITESDDRHEHDGQYRRR